MSDASLNSEAYAETCQTFKMEQFSCKILLLDVWKCLENSFVINELEGLAFTSSGKPVTDHINLASKEPSQ